MLYIVNFTTERSFPLIEEFRKEIKKVVKEKAKVEAILNILRVTLCHTKYEKKCTGLVPPDVFHHLKLNCRDIMECKMEKIGYKTISPKKPNQEDRLLAFFKTDDLFEKEWILYLVNTLIDSINCLFEENEIFVKVECSLGPDGNIAPEASFISVVSNVEYSSLNLTLKYLLRQIPTYHPELKSSIEDHDMVEIKAKKLEVKFSEL